MKRAWIFSCAVLWLGCAGTETGNPPFALTARSSDPEGVSVGSTGAGIRVERAFVAILELRRMEGEACDHLAAAPSVHRAAGDAVEGLSLGALERGPSCGVHLTLSPEVERPEGAPDAFLDRSVLLTGTLADGRRFELATDALRAVSVRGSRLELAEGDALLLTIDVAAWLAGVDLASLSEDADGVVRAGPGAAEAVRAAFEANLAAAFELYVDRDADGALDPEEEAAGPIAMGH